eukprot:TRINITY_DN40718_c0_g1_i1.p1 TRINITY_DN40718_c0_g1~~TRINITY_DN40718_c0_g1_i1.p1  ORF type:complete len:297 (+),score=75.08 TRINITY_DN40718_c0_g1_i1:54-944(+)
MPAGDVDVYAAQQMMRQGAEFWKYHYRQVGRPARVVVQLLGNGPEDQVIAWKDHGDRDFAASVSVNDIIDVRKGPHSRTFMENQQSIINPSMCFSIYTRGRTLDLEAVHPEDLKVWFAGVRHMLSSSGRGGPPEDTSYTYINSRTKEEWQYDGGRMVQHHHRSDWRARGDVHGDLIEDLERHLDMSCQQDPLDSIEEWLALKRRTTRALGPPPEPLDVDQWFKAGPYRADAAPQQLPSPAAPQIGYQQPLAPAQPVQVNEFDRGYRAGLRAASRQPAGPSYAGARYADDTVFGAVR